VADNKINIAIIFLLAHCKGDNLIGVAKLMVCLADNMMINRCQNGKPACLSGLCLQDIQESEDRKDTSSPTMPMAFQSSHLHTMRSQIKDTVSTTGSNEDMLDAD